MKPTISVLVVEDEPGLREAICDLVESEPGMEVVGRAESAANAADLAEAKRPDVAVVDVRMPGGGAEAAQGIRKLSPETSVLALSAHEDRASVVEMLRAGAVGYLVKGTPPVEIIDAIRRVSRGQASLPVAVIEELVPSLLDVTERVQGWGAASPDSSYFVGLLESAPDAAIIADESGTIVLVNARTEQQFGYTRDELLGQALETVLRETSSESRSVAAAASLSPGAGRRDFVGRHKDGTEFPVEMFLSSIETESGRLGAAFVRDASPQQQTEEFRRNAETYEALLENAPDAAVIVDETGTIVLVNAQTEQQFGYTRDELLGQPIEALLHESFRAYLAELQTQPMSRSLELSGRRKDGTEFPAAIFLSLIETKAGRLVTAFVREVAERKRAEELDRAQDFRWSLLTHLVRAGEQERARIADDIHDDPIQAITAAGMRLQILRRTIDDPEQLILLREFEQAVEFSISRLRHLVFELRPPELASNDLSAALATYLDEMDRKATTTYRLEDHLTSQPPLEMRTILYRIAQEALVNTRKHARAQNVVVALDEREGGYHVRVSDDGIGFVNDSTAPLPGHVGLGAMRDRAALAGGWLTVESAPGSGTTLDIWVPGIAT